MSRAATHRTPARLDAKAVAWRERMRRACAHGGDRTAGAGDKAGPPGSHIMRSYELGAD
jgi:hypothetical protein